MGQPADVGGAGGASSALGPTLGPGRSKNKPIPLGIASVGQVQREYRRSKKLEVEQALVSGVLVHYRQAYADSQSVQ
jgi:hypothetical protein